MNDRMLSTPEFAALLAHEREAEEAFLRLRCVVPDLVMAEAIRDAAGVAAAVSLWTKPELMAAATRKIAAGVTAANVLAWLGRR